MNFEPSEDLRAFQAALQRLLARHAGTPVTGAARFEHSASLQHALAEGGFLACAEVEGLGVLAAALLVIDAAQLPICVETLASSLIAPLLRSAATASGDLPEASAGLAAAASSAPLALLWGDAGRPARYLPVAGTVLHVQGATVRLAAIGAHDVQTLDSVFAYPVGALRAPHDLAWEDVPSIDAGLLRDRWRIGVAAEIVGCLHAGLGAVVEHVTHRRQFGRPLGSLQAVQHRLAECATAIEAARWLTLRAAQTGSPLDAALCAGQAQAMVARVTYDLHQFMGAMGLTLEHPLHRFTYRARMLRADLDGADAHHAAAARAAWTGVTTR